MPAVKPLGRKAYGSIPHLPESRVGPGDWFIQPDQGSIATTKAREGDRIISTEKADGSCCAVARVGDSILALMRAGYLATSSIYAMHHVFAAYVEAHQSRYRALLGDGDRAAGEWLLTAHGTRYDLHEDEDLFPIFDIFTPGRDRGLAERRIVHDEMVDRVTRAGLKHVPVLSDGGPLSVPHALARLGDLGHLNALEEPEGVVYRVESEGRFNYLVKYVKPNKLDGRYLPGVVGGEFTQHVLNGPAAERWVQRSGIQLDEPVKVEEVACQP